jgi:Leucine-rich repeat (LRR) protein
VDISVLSDSTTLVELNISNNEVSDITKLSGLVRLTRFDFSHNQVTKLPQWSVDCALVTIDGSYNSLRSLDELVGLKYLNNIFMDYNRNITSVNKLASCPNLIQVNVYGTKVKDVSELEKQSILVKYNPT